MNILYITKLRDSEACGVTNAVLQLLDAIRDCATVSWLDISGNTFTIEKNIRRININDINDIELDVAVFEDPFNSLTFCKIASILSKRNIPYIICPHGSFHRVALKHHAVKKYVAINTVFRVFLKNCLACQFLTSNESLQSLKFNKSIIIPNGINNTKYRIRNKCTNVVFVGRKDVKTKGIDLLIQACALSKDLLRKENITLTIYGSHETIKDDEYIRNAISSNDLQDIVIEKGPVFGLEKEKVLLEADAYIQTSRNEGFPMSILEALSYGLPCIVTYSTNLGEMIENNECGWAVSLDSAQIANAITNLVEDTKLQSKSANAVALANRFQWKDIAMQTIEEYGKLLYR